MKNRLIIIALFALLPLCAIAQINIKGTVVDQSGNPLIGAAIVEAENIRNGTTSDVDGKFSLKVKSSSSKIWIKYIGYVDKTLTAGSILKESTIELEDDSKILPEVQIVQMGFGTKSRISNVAAISQIVSKSIRQSPSASIQNALVGKLPGLFQLQRSGQPGNDAADLMIRGISSSSNNTPLVLIDDVESTIQALTQMDPNDVESISILKDAGSTAIFGIKGANGVILVTTRRGEEGAAKVTFRTDFGVQQPTYVRKSLSSYESLMLIREQYLNNNILSDLSGVDPSYKPENSNSLLASDVLEHYKLQDMPFVYPNVDWYKELYRQASIQTKQTFDIQGGSKNVKYFLSLGYLHQDGMLKKYSTEGFNNQYYLNRYNVRANLDFNITKSTLLKLGVNGVIDEKNEPYLPDPRRTGGALPFFARISSGTVNSWLYPVYNENGTYGGRTGNASTNPVSLLQWGGYTRTFTNNVVGNAAIEQQLDFITPGLKVKGLLAVTNTWSFYKSLTRDTFLEYQYDATSGTYNSCTPDTYVLPNLSSASGYSSSYPYLKLGTQIHLSYNRKFGPHKLAALILASWNSSRSAADTPDNSKGYNSRISYDYKSRYMVELSGAYNGSDKFKAKKRFDLFPALSLGWNISEEPFARDFLSDKLAVEYFKLRGSYGVVGSDYFNSSFSNYYVEKYVTSGGYYFGENPTYVNAMVLSQLPNDNVSWEKEKKLDIGTDIRLFKGKLGITADYFFNKRYNILLARGSMPYYIGIPSSVLPPRNMGKNQNQGFDGEITWRNKINKNFSYNIRGTVSHAVNKVLFNDEARNLYPALMATGHNLGRTVGYIWDGFYQSQSDIANSPTDGLSRNLKPGDLKYRDISGPEGKPDGVIDPYDQTDIGHNYPDYTFGLTLGCSYKNWDFSILFQGATGGVISSQTLLQIGNDNGVPSDIHTKRWSYFNKDWDFVTDEATLIEMNKNAQFPRFGGANSHSSTFWLRPTDYLRLKNIEIGYNFSKRLTKTLGINNARAFVTGQNLITWCALNLYQVDPESNSNADRAAYSSYPQQRLFNFGLQVTF